MSSEAAAPVVRYHPQLDFIVHNEKGYYGNLTPEQETTLAAFRERFPRDRLGRLGAQHEPLDVVLLRFLRARNFDLEKSTAMLEACLKWRAEHSVDGMEQRSPSEVLGMPLAEVHPMYPQWMIGMDRAMQPVFVRHLGKLNPHAILKRTTLDRILLFSVWQFEACMEMLTHLHNVSGYQIETFLTIIDMDGFGYKHFGSEARTFLKLISQVSSDYYPETNGGTYILNAPWWFNIAWKVVKMFLDEKTQRKIKVIKNHKVELPKHIDPQYLPPEYGGTGPELSRDWEGDHTFYKWDYSPMARRIARDGTLCSTCEKVDLSAAEVTSAKAVADAADAADAAAAASGSDAAASQAATEVEESKASS